MRHGSLFSGIGGFDLAAQWMGWENVFQVEIGPFCQRVLEKNFPNTKRYGDIKEFDGTKYRGAIDILTGGFPCQPFSTAGKRKGTEDDRHLWPEMLRIIREVQPSFIVGENVRGLTDWNNGLVFYQVLSDLENEGYEVIPFLLPACGINAPHRRHRVWIIAYAGDNGHEFGFSESGREAQANEGKAQREERHEAIRERIWEQPERIGIEAIVTNTNEIRLERRQNGTKNQQSTNGNAWGMFPVESSICGGNDGVPNRVDRIKGLGNAIVPQVAFEIFKAIAGRLW